MPIRVKIASGLEAQLKGKANAMGLNDSQILGFVFHRLSGLNSASSKYTS
jgi:hypothetical protein